MVDCSELSFYLVLDYVQEWLIDFFKGAIFDLPLATYKHQLWETLLTSYFLYNFFID